MTRYSLSNFLFKTIVLLLLVCNFTFPSFSQDYLIHQYTEDNGLPNSSVLDITQDKDGNIWFATRGGISVYDGFSWKCFSKKDGLPVSSYSQILVDKNNRIWALSEPGENGFHVVYFENFDWQENITLSKLLNKNYSITSFAIIDQQTQNHKEKDKGSFSSISFGTKNYGVFWVNNNEIYQISVKNGLLSNQVNGLLVDKEKLYVATEKGVSIIFQDSNGQIQVDNKITELIKSKLFSKTPLSIKSINIERQKRYYNRQINHDRIWIYGGKWIGFIENNIFNLVYYNENFNLPENQEYIGIFPDYQNGVYISYTHQIFYFNYTTNIISTLGKKNGLIDEGAHSIFVDFENNAWIACQRGVSKIVSRRFSNYQSKHGLLEDEVTAVLEYEPNKFILGHNNGFTFFDGSTSQLGEKHLFSKKAKGKLVIQRVLEMIIDHKKNIWIARYGKPLIKYTTGKYFESYGPNTGLISTANTLWIDQDHTIWVGTNKGIYKQKKNRFFPFEHRELSSQIIRKIYRPKGSNNDDAIYFATSRNGIFSFNNNTLNHYILQKDSNANDVYCIFKDSENRLFLGTLAGLYILNSNSIQKYISGNFRIERPVYFIVEDRNHCLWFGTDNGVIRWDGLGKNPLLYTTKEGLAGLETNRAAGILDSLDRLWFGTNRGVSIYNSNFDNYNTFIPSPKIHLLDLELPEKKIPLSLLSKTHTIEPIRLAFNNNNIGFHFKGISFIDESLNRFQAELIGYNDQWSEELYPYTQTVRYRNLPPGVYQFKLKAKNAQGFWSPEVESPKIIILSPFYKKWWFFALSALILIFFIGAIYHYISREKYSNLLTKEIRDRTQQLKETEEKYSTLFEDIQDVIFISSPDGKVIDMNPAGINLFSFNSKSEILNVDIAKDLYSNPQDRAYFKTNIEKQGFVRDYEITLKKKNGEICRAIITATSVKDHDGKVLAYRGIIRDISEKKKLEKQLERAQKMEAIGMLAGGVAHDLNNILTGLTSYPELLLMQISEDSPLRRPLMTIKQTGERAAAMVQDLLTLSRRGVEIREVINLNDIIKEYLSSPECSKLRAYQPETQFYICLDPNLMCLIGSPIHLLKTVMNLVSNAVEAMPHGGTVSILTENQYIDEAINGYDSIIEGEYAKLSVIDTGIGISQDDISRIFEPFYTRKRMGRSGTGLGMSVVWATIKDHNGYLDVKSEKGKGTTFELYFPITRQTISSKNLPEPIEILMGKENILVIDDVPEQREVAAGILTQLGYKVSTVSCGEDAVESLRHSNFDLLIIDMIMENGIDGLETYRRIINENPGQKAIIVSGFSKTEKVKEMQRLGAGNYVKKPYTIEQLGRAIRCELDSH